MPTGAKFAIDGFGDIIIDRTYGSNHVATALKHPWATQAAAELVRRANLADKLQAERDALVAELQTILDDPNVRDTDSARALLDSLTK